MPRRRPSKDYYTATEVKKILNISSGMIANYVEKGKIRHMVPPGRKHGFYLARDVDKLANELKAFFDLEETTASTFSRATKEDIPECVEVSNITLGLTSIPVKTRIKWFERNPNTFFVLKKEDEIIGYVCILPLTDIKVVEGLLHDTKLNMTPEDIAESDAKGPIYIYIMTMVVKAGFNKLEKRTYGARLVSGLIDTIIELGRKGVVIQTIAARSETPDGIRLMRKMGFTELAPDDTQRKFVIEVDKSGVPAIMQYKQALQESNESS